MGAVSRVGIGALVLAACLQPMTPGAVGEPAGVEERPSPTEGPIAPEEPLVPEEPVAPQQPARRCPVVGFEVALGSTTAGGVWDMPSAAPFLAGDAILLSDVGTTGRNAVHDFEIFAFDTRSEAITQLTANDVDDLLVDAREGAMLILERDPALRLVYADGSIRQELASGAGVSGITLAPGTWVPAPPRSLVANRQAVVWRCGEEPPPYGWCETHELVHFDGTSLGVLGTSAGPHPETPWLDGDRVLWSAYANGQLDAFLWTAAAGAVRLTDDAAEERSPQLAGPRAVWLQDGAVPTAMVLATGERSTLDEGPCSGLVVSGERIAIACTGAGEGTIQILHPDGARAVIATPGAALLGALRLAGEVVAWTAYSDPDAGCYGQTPGQVMLAPAAGGDPTPIAPVGIGCICCNSYWPVPWLELSDTLVAWTYGPPDPAAEPGSWPAPTTIGFARVSPKRVCPD